LGDVLHRREEFSAAGILREKFYSEGGIFNWTNFPGRRFQFGKVIVHGG